MNYKLYENFNELCDFVVDKLKENEIIAWFQGKSEFGPRALGNRSILANPTFDNKDYINDNIKHREHWRPYAPIMLEEELHNWYSIPKRSSPYMLFNAILLENKRGDVPSVTHHDNTARVQTVNIDINNRMYTLLKTFSNKTGVPMLLNTSFNIAGEPIVQSPTDAMKTFMGCPIKYLIIHNYIFSKENG